MSQNHDSTLISVVKGERYTLLLNSINALKIEQICYLVVYFQNVQKNLQS